MIPAPLRAPPTGITPKAFGATKSGWAFLFWPTTNSESFREQVDTNRHECFAFVGAEKLEIPD
jgi:hypothetical protein